MMRAIQRAVVCVVVVLVASAGQVQAGLIISNLPGNDQSETVAVSPSRIKAMGFTMPSGLPYQLDQIDLRLDLYGLNVNPVLQVFDSDTLGNPGTALTTLANPTFTATGVNTYSFLPQETVLLASDTTYWVVLNNLGSSGLGWTANDPGIEPTGVATHFGSKWPIAGSPPYDNSAVFNSYAIHATAIQATVVPEPSSLALVGIGACVAGVGAACHRRRERQQKTTA